VLECVGVCWSVLECVGVCWSVLECVGVCWSVLECVGVCWSAVECAAVCCSVLQHSSTSVTSLLIQSGLCNVFFWQHTVRSLSASPTGRLRVGCVMSRNYATHTNTTHSTHTTTQIIRKPQTTHSRLDISRIVMSRQSVLWLV